MTVSLRGGGRRTGVRRASWSNPLADRRVRQRVPVEIAFDCEDRGRQRQGVEKAEERPQLMLRHQAVQRRPRGRGENDRRSLQSAVVHDVEEVLEGPGVRGPIDRRADNEQVGLLDHVDDGFRPPRQRPSRDRGEEVGGLVGEFDQPDFAVGAEMLEDAADQGGRARGPQEAPRNADDLCCCHDAPSLYEGMIVLSI